MIDSIRHVVCPSCGAVNRVSATRPAQQAKCGKCHQPLFTGKPAAADGTAFERHIARTTSRGGGFLGLVVRAVPGYGTRL